jgi:Dam-replacing HTH domain
VGCVDQTSVSGKRGLGSARGVEHRIESPREADWPVGTTFTLTQVYEFENELAALHPANQNVRDTVIAAPHASSRRGGSRSEDRNEARERLNRSIHRPIESQGRTVYKVRAILRAVQEDPDTRRRLINRAG